MKAYKQYYRAAHVGGRETDSTELRKLRGRLGTENLKILKCETKGGSAVVEALETTLVRMPIGPPNRLEITYCA